MLNGKVGEINASQFSLVPGTNGKWMSAQIPLTSAQAPVAVSSVISNDRELFHLGVIHGTVGGGRGRWSAGHPASFARRPVFSADLRFVF